MTFYRKVSLRRFLKSEEPKQGKNIRGRYKEALQKKTTKGRDQEKKQGRFTNFGQGVKQIS